MTSTCCYDVLAHSALGQSTLNVSDLLFGLADTRHCSRNVIILTSAVCFEYGVSEFSC